MGHRAFIIKETEEGNYKYRYSHSGAGQFNQLKNDFYHNPEMDVDMDTVNQRFESIWEQEKEKGEDLQTASDLNQIVEPSDICIESVILKDKNGSIYLGVTVIPSDLDLTLFSEITEVLDLTDLLSVKSTVSNYLRVSDTNGRSVEDMRKEVRNQLMSNHYRNMFDTVVWSDSDIRVSSGGGIYA